VLTKMFGNVPTTFGINIGENHSNIVHSSKIKAHPE